MKRAHVAILLSCVLLLMEYHESFAEGTASITIRADQIKGRVNPLIFGNNQLGYDTSYHKGGGALQHDGYRNYGAGVWDPARRQSTPELVELEKEMGVAINRWPGGCGTHIYDWKKTIGPVEDRPDWQFGLDEFMRHCADVGCDAVITISYYTGAPQDAADLAAYLNIPSPDPKMQASQLTRSQQWALRRVKNGHPEPYGVKYFEFGNEVPHGNHAKSGRTNPRDYARRFLEYSRAMKAVDPTIKLGAVIKNSSGRNELAFNWAKVVLPVVWRECDFVIEHSYRPGYRRDDGIPGAQTIFRATLASTLQVDDYYRRLNALIRETTGGKKTIPLAITEYNCAALNSKPVPYRHVLGAALYNADLLRIFCQPESNILMANYWQLSNSFWGQVKGKRAYYGGGPHTKRPNFYPYKLYHEHFGAKVVKVSVECGAYDVPAFGNVLEARGEGQEEKVFEENLLPKADWLIRKYPGVEASLEKGILTVNFVKEQAINYFHCTIDNIPVEPNAMYQVSGWIKTENLEDEEGMAIAVGDQRGWTKTRLQRSTNRVKGTSGWTFVKGDIMTLPDTKELQIIARRWGGKGRSTVKGKAMIRDVRLHRKQSFCFPATPYLTANASLSKDGKALYLMVINKSMDDPIQAEIKVQGFTPQSEARAWLLTGPSVDAWNDEKPSTVGVQERDIGKIGASFTFPFPPHSLTAIEISWTSVE